MRSMSRNVEFVIGLVFIIVGGVLLSFSYVADIYSNESIQDLKDLERERDEMIERGEDATHINQTIEDRRPQIDDEQSYPFVCLTGGLLFLSLGFYCLYFDYRNKKKAETSMIPEYHNRGDGA